ncbi:MAG: carbohydrate binding domain-containing protein [Victivallaceae bacterium]|nr:carbohydrate binding domain-containing protein [Victivallaceae bacterium]
MFVLSKDKLLRTFALLTFGLWAGISCGKLSAGNIIMNPGFENGLKPHWQIRRFAGKGDIAEDDTISHNGKFSLRISGTADDRTGATCYPAIKVRSGETYLFKFWYKTKDFILPAADNRGIMVRFTFIANTGKSAVRYVKNFGQCGEWTEVKTKVIVPFVSENSNSLECYIAFFLWHAQGTAWFDDITLEKESGVNAADLPDPGFEEGLPPFWEVKKYGSKKGLAGLDETNRHTGQKALKISGSAKDATIVLSESPLTVSPGEKYRFSVWYKTDKVKPGVVKTGSLSGIFARISFGDENNKTYGNVVYQYEKYVKGENDSKDWRKLTKEFTVPIGIPYQAVRCNIALLLWYADGTVWFDDVKLEKAGVSPTCLRPPAVPYPVPAPQNPNTFNSNKLGSQNSIHQIWPWKPHAKGNPSVEIITERKKWIPELKNKYGIGTLLVMAMEHSNIGTGLVSDNELKAAITDYQKNGFKVLLYASLMHMSHDISWHELVGKHPEWLRRDLFGNPDKFFLNAKLCYNTPAFDCCLDHIIKMVKYFHPDGIMLDNQYNHSPCYCRNCQEKFRKYILSRFNEKEMKAIFGISTKELAQLKIEDNIDPRLFREYIEWQQFYTCAEAIEKTRRQLRKIRPDITVSANISPRFNSSGSVHPYDYEDFIIFEACALEPRLMLERSLITKAIAGNKPVYDYEYTWDHPNTSKMLSPEKLKLNLAIVIACNSIPGIVCYGFDSIPPRGINASALKAISDYLRFFKANKTLFADSADMYTNVSVTIPTPWGKQHGELLPLINNGLPFRVIRNFDRQNLKDTEVLFLINNRCLSDKQIDTVRNFVLAGGTLVFTGKTGDYTEFVEKRTEPGIFAALKLQKTNQKTEAPYGKGKAIFLPGEKDLEQVIQEAAKSSLVKINTPSKDINILPYKRLKKAGIVLHYINYNLNKTAAEIKTALVLPKGNKVKKIEYISPDNKEKIQLSYTLTEAGGKKIVNFTIPELKVYGIAVVSF